MEDSAQRVVKVSPRRPWLLEARSVFLFLSLSIVAFLGSLAVGYAEKHGEYMNPHYSVFDLQFEFGPVIRELVQHHRLAYNEPIYGILCYARRLPLIPMFGMLSYHISPAGRVFYILKNLIFWPLWIYALLRLRSCFKIPEKWVLFAAGVMLLVPYNLVQACKIDDEEGYLVALLGVLFALLLTSSRKWDYLAIGVVMGLIYLTKSSMFLLCVAAACWCITVGWRQKNRIMAILPALSLLLVAVGWGGYVHAHTGRFAFGATSSSWNGEAFYQGNNVYADQLYPRINLDGLWRKWKLEIQGPIHNEWELNDALFALGWKFVRSHPAMVVKLDLKKLDVACCYLPDAPEFVPGQIRPAVVVSNLIDHLLFAAMLAVAAYNLWRRRISRAEVLAILFVVTFLPPYLVAHLWARQMVPLYGVVALTLAIQLSFRRQKDTKVLPASEA
jgi:hypothetical protein